mgnify:CR=1 FL=1
MDSQPAKQKMALSIERLSKNVALPPWVFAEHMARFEFAGQFVKNKIVIDCACGSGIGSKIFAEARAKEIYAFDINEEEIEKVKKSNSNLSIKFQLADALSIPLPDNFADVFVSFETIEHIKKDREYLKEAKRVLKKDGIFICSTPNRTITNPSKTINDKPFNKFHVREYSSSEFINVIKEYFSISEIYGQNPAVLLKTKIITKIGKIMPFNFAVWINRLLKLRWLLIKNTERHNVVIKKNSFEYEYIVIIAKK